MSNTSSNSPSRLLPTKKDSEKFATRQGISVTNNKDGSVTYKLPKQYWGDDGVTQGVQTTQYTVMNGQIIKLKMVYYNSSDYKKYAEKYETFTWENGAATHLSSEFDPRTGKHHDIELKHQIQLNKITDCSVKMLQEGTFAEIMENNPIGFGQVWSSRNQ